MPLFNMSANIQEVDSPTRKRTHSELEKQDTIEPRACKDQSHLLPPNENKENTISLTPMDREPSPPTAKCSPGLTEPGSSPLEGNSPSPNATPTRPPLAQSTLANFITSNPTQTTNTPRVQPVASSNTKPSLSSSSTAEPPAKRTKLTPEEKAAKDAAEAKKKKGKEEAEAERLKKKKEKEEAELKKKKEKEEAEKQKAEEKAAKEAEKKRKAEEREQKRREKEEEDARKAQKRREKEEQEAKKARSQKKLTSMFNVNPTTPKKVKPVAVQVEEDQTPGTAGSAPEAKAEKSFYETSFKPFFMKENVRLANLRSADDETCEAKTEILDEWIEGKRGELPLGHFNPLEVFQLVSAPIRRGRVYPSVRKIMAEYNKTPNTIDLTTESQHNHSRHTREALRSIPVKSLKFKEDVRPPYIGTISGLPAGAQSLRKLARNPIRTDVLPLNYDYDSEAEWQEDDGEDVDDLDDDEEDADNEEDMDDFLDDSEDVGPARLLFSGGMEPESSGLCWENRKRLNETAKMYKYKMEFILDTLDHHSGINPFSGEYWAPPPKPDTATVLAAALAAAAPSTTDPKPTSTDSKAKLMAPPPAPSDAFQALASSNPKKPQQALPADLQEELKGLLRSMPNLSKVGIIEVFASTHSKCPKLQIKAAFDAMTEKVGKSWKLKGT